MSWRRILFPPSLRLARALWYLRNPRSITQTPAQPPANALPVALCFSLFGFSKSSSEPEPLETADAEKSKCPVSKADQMMKRGEYLEAVQLLDKLAEMAEPSMKHEVIWRKSYALYLEGRLRQQQNLDYKPMFKEAYAAAKEAFELNPDHYASNLMMGLTMAEAKVHWILSKVRALPDVVKYLKTAVDLNPSSELCQYYYGSFCFVLAVLPKFARDFAGPFVKVPESSFEDALFHFERAESLQPEFMCRNQVAIAVTFYKMERYEEAVKWMRKAAEFPAKNLKDELDMKDAKGFLERWSTAKQSQAFFK